MKKIVAVLAVLAVLTPAFAFAGGSTDAALGLGAFAVFNQILSGTGVFGGLLGTPVVAAPPPPVVYAPPPPVVYAPPPPPVVYAPPAPVVYQPPPPVIVAPRPVVVAPYYRGYHPPHPRYAPVYRPAPHPGPRWCPPGHAKHGRC